VVDPLTLDALRAARAERYRRLPHLRVTTEAQALSFLNDVGLCLLFSDRTIELPTLWGAICGYDRSVPVAHDDHDLGLAWSWKDTLPVAGKVLYGKFLRKKPAFIALDLAPYFYALSPNYGDPAADYLEDYRDGRLPVESKQVYEALLEHGALPTSRLRLDAGLGGQGNAARFDRALADLQMDMRIVKVAVSEANRWGYCYVYDLFPRHFLGVVEAARGIGGGRARETILLRYLQTVIAATPHQVGHLFGWQPGDVGRLVARLTAEGKLRAGVLIEGLPGDHLLYSLS
jgi:hypothetical protein